jgi:alpha-L-fucosidase
VGPDAKGRIPKESVKILEEVGDWMAENSRSIYGCGYAGIEKPEWGRYTRKGNKIYAHVMEAQTGAIPLTGIHGKIAKLRRVSDNSEVRLTNYWNLKEYSQNQFFFLNANTCDSYPLPDERDTVVEVTLEEE